MYSCADKNGANLQLFFEIQKKKMNIFYKNILFATLTLQNDTKKGGLYLPDKNCADEIQERHRGFAGLHMFLPATVESRVGRVAGNDERKGFMHLAHEVQSQVGDAFSARGSADYKTLQIRVITLACRMLQNGSYGTLHPTPYTLHH